MSGPGLPVHFRDLPCTERDGLSTYVVHSDLGGSGLEQSVLTAAGRARASRDVAPGCDEVLYVLTGTGEAIVAGASHQLRPGVAVRIAGGSRVTVHNPHAAALEIVAVRGRAVSSPRSAEFPKSADVDCATLDTEEAVGNREFRVLFDNESGCSGMTQFLGYVPRVRTPRHVHPYSEMLCIAAGSGTVEIGGEKADVGVGSCYYLPAGVPHRVENTEDEYLVELGVFTPSGSPAQNTPIGQ